MVNYDKPWSYFMSGFSFEQLICILVQRLTLTGYCDVKKLSLLKNPNQNFRLLSKEP